jgi:hypothetical protein
MTSRIEIYFDKFCEVKILHNLNFAVINLFDYKFEFVFKRYGTGDFFHLFIGPFPYRFNKTFSVYKEGYFYGFVFSELYILFIHLSTEILKTKKVQKDDNNYQGK